MVSCDVNPENSALPDSDHESYSSPQQFAYSKTSDVQAAPKSPPYRRRRKWVELSYEPETPGISKRAKIDDHGDGSWNRMSRTNTEESQAITVDENSRESGEISSDVVESLSETHPGVCTAGGLTTNGRSYSPPTRKPRFGKSSNGAQKSNFPNERIQSTTPTNSPGRDNYGSSNGDSERPACPKPTSQSNPFFISGRVSSNLPRTQSPPDMSMTPTSPECVVKPKFSSDVNRDDPPTEDQRTKLFTFHIPQYTSNDAAPLQGYTPVEGVSITKGTFGQIYKIKYPHSYVDVKCRVRSVRSSTGGEAKRVLIQNNALAIKLVEDNKGSAISDALLEAQFLTDMNMPKPQKYHGLTQERFAKHSPFIIDILDHFYLSRSPKTYCLVFPYYSGGNLLARYDFTKKGNEGLIPSKESTLNIAFQLINALAYLSIVQYIHADIKPENIQFERPDCDRLRLIDFGSAEPLWDDGQEKSLLVCTDQYRPPEIILRKPCYRKETTGWDASVDVWSAGCIIYELLHGRQFCPVDSGDDYERFVALAKEQLHPSEVSQCLYESGLKSWELMFHREQLYRIQRVSAANKFCQGFCADYLSDQRSKCFFKSRHRQGERPASGDSPKVVKWCFQRDNSVDYVVSSNERLAPAYRDVAFCFLNGRQLEYKMKRVVGDDVNELDDRYFRLAELAQKMLVIDSRVRSYAADLLEEYFNEADYPQYIPLPSSERTSIDTSHSSYGRNSNPRSPVSRRHDDSYRPQEKQPDHNYRQDQYQARRNSYNNGNYRQNGYGDHRDGRRGQRDRKDLYYADRGRGRY